jgi:uncharacterized protein (TIGR00255 family)
MIKSMTGFGKFDTETPNYKLNIEIRSLNSKQLDLSLKLPYPFRAYEMELRQFLSTELVRGKVDVYISIEKEANKTIDVNEELLMAYYKTIKNIAVKIGEENQAILPLLLKQPDIYKTEKKESNENEIVDLKNALKSAVKKFDDFRNQEGSALEKDLSLRLSNIEANRDTIRTLDKNRIDAVKQRLTQKILDIKEVSMDKNRFEQELIYFIEKLDINEELVRLDNHLRYFKSTMSEKDAGRKLGFITQEIGREINTIGSKCNDAEMQKIVVNMKDDLEKIKEQSLNIL